ncbi:hypothetical protein L0Y49_02285, partial [bacterium]|nr:hypothetical protein [bacterium]MCI0566060.1 hypothetical protein [bacterium]
RLKISTIFFAFLAAFSPRTMNSRYVNSFFTSSNMRGFAGVFFACVLMSFFILSPLGGVFFAYAHGSDDTGISQTLADADDKGAIEDRIKDRSVSFAIISGIIIFILSILAFVTRCDTGVCSVETFKKILFGLFIIFTIAPTLYFAGGTIYLNIISDSKGPVHWHLDFRIFKCGEEIRLAGPSEFLSNKVGTATFHHHDDMRIHVEGVVVDIYDYELRDFFSVIGGALDEDSFTIPAETGAIQISNGETCPSGGRGEWQAFLYSLDENGRALQRKLSPFSTYIMSPEANIPPGDCVIFEFGPLINRTEHICPFYEKSL